MDKGSVEIYANDGLVPMSFFYLPEPENGTLSVFCKDGKIRLDSMEVYEMNSIWD